MAGSVRSFEDDLRLDLEDLEDLEDFEERYGVLLPRRTVLDRANPLEALREDEFRTIFSFSKDGFKFVLDKILPAIQSTEAGHRDYLTPVQKLSIFLDFLRTNSFQRVIGTQIHNRVSQGRSCLVINNLAAIIAGLRHEVVRMPSKEEGLVIAEEFFRKTGFPYVQGLIDGTHIEILKPIIQRPAPEKFYNRKGFYSLNVMVVCDHQKKIRYFSARHAGSAHDSRIFRESPLHDQLHQDFDHEQPLVLLGDEGYGCSQILLTPIRRDRVADEHQRRYNQAHRRARISVEHCFGMVKKRFPALLQQLRCRKLSNIQAIIASAFVLHNMFLDLREDPPVLPPNILEPDFQQRLHRGQINILPMGRPIEGNFFMRNRVIGQFF